MKCVWTVLALCLAAGIAAGQGEFGCICSTDAVGATGSSNSHKLAAAEDVIGRPGDAVLLAYVSDGGIIIRFGSFDSPPRLTWSSPLVLAAGINPGVDVCAGRQHVVWEFADTASGACEIRYIALNSSMNSIRISDPSSHAVYPDVVGDNSGQAHIVWEDYSSGLPRIYYRPCRDSVPGDRMLVSVDTLQCNYRPSISMFAPDSQICVLWQAYDSSSRSPYIIKRRRCVHGTWQDEEVLARDWLPLRNVSLDYDHGSDVFSGAWEDSTSGKQVAHFEGGNGGGGETPGASFNPVVATCGDVWSYLFWASETSGYRDIYQQDYYFMSGWGLPLSLRSEFGIAEPIWGPNCLGALVVWTQGDAPPYKLMYAYFNYPIAVRETRGAGDGLRNVRLSARPNPAQGPVSINYDLRRPGPAKVSITDAAGREVVRLLEGRQKAGRYSVSWSGLDRKGVRVIPGVYFTRLETGAGSVVSKVVLR